MDGSQWVNGVQVDGKFVILNMFQLNIWHKLVHVLELNLYIVDTCYTFIHCYTSGKCVPENTRKQTNWMKTERRKNGH